jgi:hypothetical protein
MIAPETAREALAAYEAAAHARNGSAGAETPAPERPAPEDGAALLDALAAFVRRFVVITDEQAAVIALWVVHTHALDACEATPYISITSPEKESGKTRLLEVLDALVARAWFTGRATAAVLVRKIDKERPTLLLDESDAAFQGEKEYAEALRGLLNTGYRASGRASLCVGQGANIGYRDFSTFGAKAIAGIGQLPDTVASRAVPIRLERRARGEHVEAWRERRGREAAAPLHKRAEAWAASVEQTLRHAEPDPPRELGDRAQDTAEPLLAIADVAGGDWPERARAALVTLHGERTMEAGSAGVRLLADVRTVFDARNVDRLATADLLEGLHGLEDAPWSDWSRGRSLAARGLGDLLRPYRVRSRTVRLDDEGTAKGFKREQFEDAWDRYTPVPPPSKGNNVTTRSGSGIAPDSYPSQDRRCDGLKTAENPHGERVVTDVTDRSALTGPERPKTADENVAETTPATAAEEAELERLQAKFEASNGGTL